MSPLVSHQLTYLINKYSLNISFIAGDSQHGRNKTEENKMKPSISRSLCN